MSFFQNIWSDLVEKRLWPFALLLVGGIVAVALLVTAKDPATPPPAPALVSGDVAKPGEIVLADSGVVPQMVVRKKTQKVDPFRRPKAKVKLVAVPGGLGSAIKAGAGGGDTGTKPQVTTPSAAAPLTGPTRVTIRFGDPGKQQTFKNIEPLTPLPSADNPLFVYVKPAPDGHSAIFMISTDATPTGDGQCAPTADDCQELTLAAGDTEFFEVGSGTPDATTTQYQLDVLSVSGRGVKKAPKAN